MPANTSPIFTLTPNVGVARITAANTARDGSGANISTVFTAGANGSRIDRITVTESDATASSTSVSQLCRVWVYNGSNYFLYKELVVPTVAGTTTVATGTVTLNIIGGLIIPTGWTIRCAATLGSTTTGQLDVVIEGGDY